MGSGRSKPTRSCAICHPCHPRNPWSFRRDRLDAQSKSKALLCLLNVCRRKHPTGSLRELSRSARLCLLAANLFGCGFAAPGLCGCLSLAARLRRAKPFECLPPQTPYGLATRVVCQHPPVLPVGLPAAGYLAPLGSLRSAAPFCGHSPLVPAPPPCVSGFRFIAVSRLIRVISGPLPIRIRLYAHGHVIAHHHAKKRVHVTARALLHV